LVYRFIHSADIHLDSPLKTLALSDPKLSELIGNATRQALRKIVDLCINERVDALVLAGDVYDGEQTSMKTARFFASEMHRLHQAGIKVFLVRGNHDALSKITNELTLPDNVKLFTGRAEYVEIDPSSGGLPLAIHGISFSEAKAPASLLSKFRPRVENAINIGILHTSLTGSDGHNTYAPCTIGELNATGFQYWALGHIHKRSVYDGACKIVMPGNPQGRDINEAGAKTATLVTIDDDGSLVIEERHTGLAEFARIAVNLQNCNDWSDVIGATRSALQAARAETKSEHLVARLLLTGATPTAWGLRSNADRLKAEADVMAEQTGKSWIEKIDIGCTLPAATSAAATSNDPLSELMSEIDATILTSDAFALRTEEAAREILNALPVECRASFGIDEAAFKAEIQELSRQGAEQVLARLQSQARTEIA